HFGEDSRLSQKAPRAAVREDLQRDPLVGLRVPRSVHQAHRPGAGEPLDVEPPRDDVARTHLQEISQSSQSSRARAGAPDPAPLPSRPPCLPAPPAFPPPPLEMRRGL